MPHELPRSMRLYLWIPILLNVLGISLFLEATFVQALLLGLALCCLASFGFVINDLWDRPVDKINAAGRLEWASSESIRLAYILANLLLVVGILAAAVVGRGAVLLSAAIAIGLLLYTLLVRSVLFFATLLASALSLSPLLGPLLLFDGELSPFLTGVVTASWLTLMGREILLDVKDRLGDQIAGRLTIPIVFGEKISSRAAAFLIMVGGLTLLVAAAATSSVPILLFSVVIVGLYIVPSGQLLVGKNTRASLVCLIRLSRVAMSSVPFLLVLAFLVER